MGKGNYCIVCRHNQENSNFQNINPSLFQFPTSFARRELWLKRLGLNSSQLKTGSKVCELHFPKNQFIRTRLKKDAIPSLSLFENQTSKSELISIYPKPLKVLGQSCSALIPQLSLPRPILPHPIQNTGDSRLDNEQKRLLERLIRNRKTKLQKRKQYVQQIKRLRTQVNHLNEKLTTMVDIKEIFKGNPLLRQFIENQIQRHQSKTTTYNESEKTAALSIYYSCGPNGYKTLNRIGFVLPNYSSIFRWTSELQTTTGCNDKLLNYLSNLTSQLKKMERDCVLTWDEMGIKEFIEYNKHYDIFEGIEDYSVHGRSLQTANEVLVFMIRGVNASWKFPISYYFSKNATTADVLELVVVDNIKAIRNINLNIRLCICDMSFTNQALYRSWNITSDNPCKSFDGHRIYFIHDTPHLLKLVRNNLLKHNFIWEEKTGNIVRKRKIKWSHINSFYVKDKRLSSRMAPRLTSAHIYVKDYSKMKVKLAAQTLSHSVYSGIVTMIRLRILKKDTMDTALFIKKVDQMFDFLNMSMLKNDKWGRCATHFYQNFNKFQEFTEFLSSISIPTLSREPEFLKGFILTISGIKFLAEDLKNEGYSYIFTRNLQQDCLENFFSMVRSKGGFCRNPTARCFRSNFRFLFFATLCHAPQTGNVEPSCVALQNYVNNLTQCRILKGEKSKGFALMHPINLDKDTLTTQEAASFYSVRLARRLKFGREQDEAVASYLGAACIVASLKLSSCNACSQMLVNAKKAYEGKIQNYLLIDYKQYDSSSNHLAYLRNTECNLFQHLSSKFESYACESLTSIGVGVALGIFDRLKQEIIVKNWLEEQCTNHRENIIKYFIRAKIFRLVKDKNEQIKQIRCWSQTRRDLRNQ